MYRIKVIGFLVTMSLSILVNAENISCAGNVDAIEVHGDRALIYIENEGAIGVHELGSPSSDSFSAKVSVALAAQASNKRVVLRVSSESTYDCDANNDGVESSLIYIKINS